MKHATTPLYIRFGDIPTEEKSRVWISGVPVEKELGVSVYHAVETCGMFFPILPDESNSDGVMDYFMFLLHGERPVYLVTGDELGFEGKNREPLLRNVIVLKDITDYYRNNPLKPKEET